MTSPPNWQNKNSKLTREFTFTNFKQAIAFVNQVAELAENQNHHPDILIHDYKKVTITLTTHDAGNKITSKDTKLAKKINGILEK